MFDIQKKIRQYKSCQNIVSFDVETTGLLPYHGDRIFSFCIGNDLWCGVYRIDQPYFAEIRTQDLLKCITEDLDIWKFIKVKHRDSKINFMVMKTLFEKLSNQAITIHNCKFEKGFLSVHGIEMPDNLVIHDPMLMSRLLDNQSPSHELGRLVHRLGGDPLGRMMKCDKKVEEEAKKLGGYNFVNVPLMTIYQLYDAVRPLLLQNAFFPEICERENLLEDYIWEVQTALCTQEIEEEGIQVHEKNCYKLLDWLDNEITNMQHECFNLIGEYINLSSDQQVERILFKKLGFPVISFSTKGRAKTDKDVLFKLKEDGFEHPFIDLVLKWRSYNDGQGNIQKYLDLRDENGRIHTTINTCQARTHRQSSSKPNLQNVSKEAALKNPYAVPSRQCFTCSED